MLEKRRYEYQAPDKSPAVFWSKQAYGVFDHHEIMILRWSMMMSVPELLEYGAYLWVVSPGIV